MTLNEPLWDKVFKGFVSDDLAASFSLYRIPYETEADIEEYTMFLHILYLKSTQKSLSRNYNSQELEIFCHNRFYGPLVVAFSNSKAPHELLSFTLGHLKEVESTNKSFQNKCIKDDFVPECLLNCSFLNNPLNQLYQRDDHYLFYMFFYKTSWCPHKRDSHDSKGCIYAHHMRDFRRPPDYFSYEPGDCETFQSGIGWDLCPRGLKCPKSHTSVERLYHPDKYKRVPCDNKRCNKLEICAFFHAVREKNMAIRIVKGHRKSRSNGKLPNINKLNEEFLAFQKEAESKAVAKPLIPLQSIKVKEDYFGDSFGSNFQHD